MVQSRTKQENLYFLWYNMRQLMCIPNLKIKSYEGVLKLLEINPKDNLMGSLDPI